MKNALMIVILNILLFTAVSILSIQNAGAEAPLQNLSISNYDINEGSSSTANTDSQADVGTETDATTSALFPYFFYALFILGLLAVLSFDTSGNARSKRKQESH